MTTVGEDSVSVVVDLPIEPTITMSALRGHLATTLDDLGEDHRYDVLLVVTEPVSNVLDHTPGFGRLRVVRSRTPCEITIEPDGGTEPASWTCSVSAPHRERRFVIAGGCWLSRTSAHDIPSERWFPGERRAHH